MNCYLKTVFFFTVLSLSQEVSIENVTSSSTAGGSEELGASSSTAVPEEPEEKRVSGNRTLHSRMKNFEANGILSTTTQTSVTEYDFWWFFTTPKRPFISYRDYPGKPGVASWKEISPITGKESKKSRKDDPTAAEVASSAPSYARLDLAALLVSLMSWYINYV